MVNYETCQYCERVITNPICARCYLKSFLYWLNDHGLDKKEKSQIIDYIKTSLMEEDDSEDNCILCNSECVDICTYCFFSRLEDFMKKNHASKKIIEDFSHTFNYDLYSDHAYELTDKDDRAYSIFEIF